MNRRVMDFNGEAEMITSGEEQTLALAERFAHHLKPGDVVALYGEMGTGKTHFVKGVVKGLGGDPDNVDSPTFAIINEYGAGGSVYHMDCYRLSSEEEAEVIGVPSYFDGMGICLIEWPERIEGLLPPSTIRIKLEHKSPTERSFMITTSS